MTEPLPILPIRPTAHPESSDDLKRAGWTRRHLVEQSRAQESIELYTEMGFEVTTRSPTPSDFGADCKDCALNACGTWVVVYTRKR